MSQTSRESRRAARRAESLNPRDRRRRRLNDPSSSDHTFDSFIPWLDQRMEQEDTDASHQSRGRPTARLSRSASFDSTQALGPTDQHNPNMGSFSSLPLEGRSSPNLVQTMGYSAHPQNDRTQNPKIPLDQIVSSSLPTPSTDTEQGASSDRLDWRDDDISLDDADHIFFHGLNDPPSPVMRARGNAWGRRSALLQALHAARRGKNPKTFPEHPSVVLVCQQDAARDNTTQYLRYLPFVPVSKKNKSYMIQQRHKQRIDSSRTAARRAEWVPNEMPVEIFEEITQHLSRDDIKAMRLVSREFERGVSRTLFDTVVVPFNTELYSMMEQERTVVKRDLKGKRRVDDPINDFIDLEPGSLQWKNAMEDSEDKVYRGHGLQVFEGFGGHIRRFGMSFEVREDALRDPPQKNVLNQHESYFGSYDWPSQDYTRFEKLAGLERTADEISQMKLAFSHLSKVQQLALSLDSGLGWLNGPDRSLRSLIQRRPPRVFGCSHGVADAQQQERSKLWETLESAHDRMGTLDDLKEGQLERADLKDNFFQLPSLSDTPYSDPATWAEASAHAVDGVVKLEGAPEASVNGVLYISNQESEARNLPMPKLKKGESCQDPESFSPASLTKYQKEWLLEAEWAQRAFLTTYMLAIVDDNAIFSRVSVLNLARLSSHLVPLLCRDDFWDALPNVRDVTLGVIPDWRIVEREAAGFVETQDVDPSEAVDKASLLIQDFIGPRPIKKFHFKWAAGGEHAEGIFARNHHILPAPVTSLENSTIVIQSLDQLVKLPNIEELTFSNCWFTPVALVQMVKKLQKCALRRLKLESVSLTAHPRNVANAAANQHGLVGVLQAPGMIMLGGHYAAQFGAQVWQGPPVGVDVQQWAQTMLQNLNFMMANQGIVLHQLPQIWTNHPTGMTMQQIMGMLTNLAAGGHVTQPGMLFQQQHLHQNQPTSNNYTLTSNAQANASVIAQYPVLPAQNNAPHPPPMPLANVQPHQQPQANHHGHGHGHAAHPNNWRWYEGHRSGSWTNVIDHLSPGPRLEMYRARGEFEPEPEKRKTGLESVEFVSCGYVQLRNARFDQTPIEAPASYRMSRYFTRRQSVLSPAMLSTSDKNLGTIVQYMPEREANALLLAWGLTMGWRDTKLAEEAEYDGYLPGGTGRFSGSVTKDTLIRGTET